MRYLYIGGPWDGHWDEIYSETVGHRDGLQIREHRYRGMELTGENGIKFVLMVHSSLGWNEALIRLLEGYAAERASRCAP